MPVFPAEYLSDVYQAIARKCGASAEEADAFARHTVTADLNDMQTAGIGAIPLFYRWLQSGGARFGAPIQVVNEGPAFAVVDGGYGLGQVVGTRAMEIAIEKARASVVGAVWIRNVTGFGMVGYYPMLALAHDYAGIAMANTAPLVAPWGGRDQLFGTNPYAIAVPAGQESPIVIDSSASAISHGRVVQAARDKQRLPGKFLVDEQGHFTDDPVPFIVDASDRNSPQRGAILPLGHKGFGWLLFVDIFAGIMSGMTASKDVVSEPTSENPSTSGRFVMAIDVGALMPIAEFKAKVDDLIRSVRASRRAEGFDEIVLPGEREARLARRRRSEGIPVRDDHWNNIVAIARDAGMELEAPPVVKK